MKYNKLALFILISLILILNSCMSMPNQPTKEEKALITYVLYRNVTGVEQLLKDGVNPNSRSVAGQPVLTIALNNNDLKTAQTLVSYGANVNGTDTTGASALFYAKKPEIHQWLIDNGADVTLVSNKSTTGFENWCLNHAIILSEEDKEQSLNIIKSQGIQVTKEDLEKSVWVNRNDIIQSIKIFVKAGYNLNTSKTDENYTPLILSALSDNYILMEELINAGADPQIKNRNGDDALNIITSNQTNKHTYNEYKTIVNSLLKHGADINATDGNGNTPLCNAAIVNNENRVSVLLSIKDCKVDGKGEYGETALFKTSSYDIVKKLIGAGADVNFQSTYGYTPLFTQTNVSSVQYLINKGADVNHISNDGENILIRDMYKAYDSFKKAAISSEEIENHYIGKVKILIGSGINVNHRWESTTSLYWAKKAPFKGIVDQLVAAGAR